MSLLEVGMAEPFEDKDLGLLVSGLPLSGFGVEDAPVIQKNERDATKAPTCNLSANRKSMRAARGVFASFSWGCFSFLFSIFG